jgi:6-phosphogluconolactonase (cycloisomerase 2 family)
MNGSAAGITALRSRADGSLEPDPSFRVELQSPAFLAQADGVLYALLEGTRQIAAVSIADQTVLATADTGGQWPCHVGIYGETLVVANYHDGTIGVLASDPLSLTAVLGAAGSGPHPSQDGPHAHSSIELEPGVVVSADLGADELRIHALVDGELERLGDYALPAGTGPRDLLRHPSGLLYVLGEHGRSIIILEWVDEQLRFVDSCGLPGAVDGDQAAALALSDAGFLYAGLRGSNLISVLKPTADGRSIEGVGAVPTAGEWPRHLAVEGTILHVANQLSNSIASFSLDEHGMPKLIAEPTPVASPTYLLEA